MPKVTTFLNKETIQNLKELCENSGKSLSKVTSEFVEAGYQMEQHQEMQKVILDDKNTEFVLKEREYMLRIVNICSEILRRVHNEPSELPGKTANYILSEIKKHAETFVENRLRKGKIREQ